MTALTPELASYFARLTLGHLGREYPHKLDHVMKGPEDVRTPADLHPIFHGSFDWHSCVHGWWQVMRISSLFPDLPETDTIRQRAATRFTLANFEAELAYAARPESSGFERPYGWAWALALHLELTRHSPNLANNFEPLARHFALGFKEFLPKLTYPIRVGTHANMAFSLTLALDWSVNFDADLSALIAGKANDWFASDQGCQAWEPGGDEFLSPALCEAMLMSRTLDDNDFVRWFDKFLPDMAKGMPRTLVTPARVSDRSDGKIAHLDGLNLSRAWCWTAIAGALPASHPVILLARDAAARHLDASLPHIADTYMGEHWLATFALLALDGL